jgi:alkylated DNA repair protein alkB homolog 7
MHVTSWPESDVPGLPPLIERLQKLCPTPDTQTHILHLASNGEILPHVDNLQASGNWILGVSLGAERIMRMESTDGSDDSFDVLLPSGSVYLQR